MTDRMTAEELAQLEQVLKAYRFKPSENMTTDVEWRLLQALKAEREYTRNLKESLDGAELDNAGLVERISELEAQLKAKCDHSELLAEIKEQDAFINKQNRQIKHREKIWKARAAELQRKYDALVERLEHMAEMWDEKDRAAWRTDPSKHLNGFKCADELRALLEDDDG